LWGIVGLPGKLLKALLPDINQKISKYDFPFQFSSISFKFLQVERQA
jgi:hypothetical protein